VPLSCSPEAHAGLALRWLALIGARTDSNQPAAWCGRLGRGSPRVGSIACSIALPAMLPWPIWPWMRRLVHTNMLALVHADYDVQPAEEPDWRTDPFECNAINEYLYGRGCT